MLTVQRPGVMETMHNLDYCDVLVIGEELNPGKESLEIRHSALLGKHLDATNSTSGISIYGGEGVGHTLNLNYLNHVICQTVSRVSSRRGLHFPLRAGSEAGALQELATCEPEREKVPPHLLRAQRTLHQQRVQYGGWPCWRPILGGLYCICL